MAGITKIRTPLLVCIALVVCFLVIGIELGSSYRASGNMLKGLGGRFTEMKDSFGTLGKSGADKANSGVKKITDLEDLLDTDAEEPPGYGIASLQYVDLLLLFSVFMIALPLAVKASIVAKLQGIITIIVSLIVLVFGILFLLKVLVMLFLMIGLMLAIPFGTIIYMVLYGFFETGKAAAIMSSLMVLKIAIPILLIAAHEQFIKNLGLILLIGTSLITMIILSFLHNFLPIFLVSITDAAGALINTLIALIWALILLISGIISVIKVIAGLDKVFK